MKKTCLFVGAVTAVTGRESGGAGLNARTEAALMKRATRRDLIILLRVFVEIVRGVIVSLVGYKAQESNAAVVNEFTV